jgi:hypothetical protein
MRKNARWIGGRYQGSLSWDESVVDANWHMKPSLPNFDTEWQHFSGFHLALSKASPLYYLLARYWQSSFRIHLLNPWWSKNLKLVSTHRSFAFSLDVWPAHVILNLTYSDKSKAMMWRCISKGNTGAQEESRKWHSPACEGEAPSAQVPGPFFYAL